MHRLPFLALTALLGMLPVAALAGNKPQSITVTQAAPSSAAYGSQFHVAATASSGLPVSVTGSGGCSGAGSGSAFIVMESGTANCTVSYSQPGDGIYRPADSIASITTATKAEQTLAFNASPGPLTFGTDNTFTVGASSSSALPVTYSSLTNAVCAADGNTGAATILTAGICTIAADQAGDANYQAAIQATQNITINKIDQTIAFGANPGPLTFTPGATFTVSASASSGLPVTYTTTTGSVCNVNSSTGVVMASTLGTCTIVATQIGDENYNSAPQAIQNITINKADQTGIAAGTTDITFNVGADANAGIYGMAAQQDGRVIVGGDFTTINGVASNRLARLHSDGSQDTTFDAGTGPNGKVLAVVLQVDGKVIVGGDFTAVNGVTRHYIARLNTDGSLDTSFDTGANINGIVRSLLVQTDNKIVIGGDFTTVSGVARNRIARLHADDGSLDASFTPGAGANSSIMALAAQQDGKLVIGGVFTAINNVARNYIARLNVDGSLDTAFDAGTSIRHDDSSFGIYCNGECPFDPYSNSGVFAIALQTDGKIVIGGNFYAPTKFNQVDIARLHTDGSLDISFNQIKPGYGYGFGGDYNDIYTLAIQADGRILIGGNFEAYQFGTGELNYIARLNEDGWLDTTFSVDTTALNTNHAVYALAVQQDGKLTLAGTSMSNQVVTASRLLRVHTGDVDADSAQDAADAFAINPMAAQDNDHDGLPDAWLQPNAYACTISAASCNGLVLDHDDDGDGIADVADNCPLSANTDQLNSDNDPQGNACDGDDDNDGVDDASDALPLNAAESGDIDHDGIGNNVDMDNDNDGLDDSVDNCPLITNVDQLNTDGDTQGDVCDSDDDNDGVADGMDNCPLASNPNQQLDADADGVADACDPAPYVAPAASRDVSFKPGINDAVHAMAEQPDGRILIGGQFTDANGIVRNRIARLNADGSLDTSFNSGTGANSTVRTIATQPDGKVLIGGYFSVVNGMPHNKIARLNADGSLDSTFNTGSGTNAEVVALAVQADGKVLLGGGFTSVNGVTRNRIARLNTNGSLDTGFNVSANDYVLKLAVQTDGKIVIAGSFTTVNGVMRNRIARLNADGSLDSSFDSGTGASDYVSALALQADGKVLIGGNFGMLNGVARIRIARLNADGSLDSSFNPGTGANYNAVAALVVQGDGKVLLGGGFTSVNGTVRNRIARLNTDGSLDNNFNPGTGANEYVDYVLQLVTQTDGRLLVGGRFNNYISASANFITRVHTGDSDADSIEDAADTDNDNDGVPNDQDAFPLNAAESADTDHDDIGNNADLDDDSDNVPDYIDAEPLNAAVNNESLLPLHGGFSGASVSERLYAQ